MQRGGPWGLSLILVRPRALVDTRGTMLWGGTGPTLHRYTWLTLPQVIPWPGLVLCDPLYPFCKTVMTTVLLHRVALGLKETGVRALCTTGPGGARRAGLRPVIVRRLVQQWGPPGLAHSRCSVSGTGAPQNPLPAPGGVLCTAGWGLSIPRPPKGQEQNHVTLKEGAIL